MRFDLLTAVKISIISFYDVTLKKNAIYNASSTVLNRKVDGTDSEQLHPLGASPPKEGDIVPVG